MVTYAIVTMVTVMGISIIITGISFTGTDIFTGTCTIMDMATGTGIFITKILAIDVKFIRHYLTCMVR